MHRRHCSLQRNEREYLNDNWSAELIRWGITDRYKTVTFVWKPVVPNLFAEGNQRPTILLESRCKKF